MSPRDLLCSTVPIANNTLWLYYSTFAKKVDVKCSYTNTNNKQGGRRRWEVMVMSVVLMVVMGSRVNTFIPRLIELDTLNLYSFLHVSQTSIKWLKKNLPEEKNLQSLDTSSFR